MIGQAKILLVLGALASVVSFLGLPETIKKIALLVLGLAVAVLARLILRRLHMLEDKKDINNSTYTEHRI